MREGLVLSIRVPEVKIRWHDDLRSFVDHWDQFYDYPLEHLYSERIRLQVYSVEDIEKLFIWKNGTSLSKKKYESLHTKITPKIQIINDLKQRFILEAFIDQFSDVSTIWKIFLLHIIVPQLYPIFDQHVYRAYRFINNHMISEIPSSDRQKEQEYFNNYVYFFREIERTSERSPKKIDEALWAFGKFLKTFSPILNF